MGGSHKLFCHLSGGGGGGGAGKIYGETVGRGGVIKLLITRMKMYPTPTR